MPTVLLLDSSLSMLRPVTVADGSDCELQRRHLANDGITTLLEYLTANCRLEFTSLVTFSSMWRMPVNFTRDYSEVRGALLRQDESLCNKTCMEAALTGVATTVLEEWGVAVPIEVVLITDGNPGVGHGSLRHMAEWLAGRSATGKAGSDLRCPLPFNFPCRFHVMCIAPSTEPALQVGLPMLQRIIDGCGGGGSPYVPDGLLSAKSVQTMFGKFAEDIYKPFHGVLKCGALKSNIQVFPPPNSYTSDHDFEHIDLTVHSTLEICGFLDISDLSSPPFLSRHLVLPIAMPTETEGEGEEGEEDAGKAAAAVTVLLHGALKVEGMLAVIQLADNWFGILYSWADSKKKSNLMLSVFIPGTDVIPWIGNISCLAPIDDFSVSPYGEPDAAKTPFPIRPSERRSYAQNCVVWIKQAGLQADIQKILRNARKLPEKQQHFYKELNRLKKAALSFGFHELLQAVASLLERECTLLPGNAHPDAAMQLTHAASELTGKWATDVSSNISPLRTNFSAE